MVWNTIKSSIHEYWPQVCDLFIVVLCLFLFKRLFINRQLRENNLILPHQCQWKCLFLLIHHHCILIELWTSNNQYIFPLPWNAMFISSTNTFLNILNTPRKFQMDLNMWITILKTIYALYILMPCPHSKISVINVCLVLRHLTKVNLSILVLILLVNFSFCQFFYI